ncbi:hypothetical protein DXM27_05075 [Rhizobium rhizogenes]|uniref:Right handed beta helix domain-containing protein n=1 Tax=Rhizobium rhizogenes TaxID=359 RepID=A0AA88F6T3_RHIRH|nr:right-handed parallel beta-helix repeat-containing protein [Rhizobium rhizogenes]KAA3504587.1 hypothetical protein DXM27_05075 [Rhizobium rhizogenes]
MTFTAVGDGLTDDTDALNSFIAASDYGTIPPGCYRTTAPLVFRNGQRIEFSGDASIIKPDGNVTDKVLDLTGVCHTSIAHLRVQPPANADLKCISLDACQNVTIERVRFQGGGGYPIFINGSLDCQIDDIHIAGGYLKSGIQVNDSKNVTVSRPKVYAGNAGWYGIQSIRGANIKFKGGYVERTPNVYFGIHTWGTNFGVVEDCHVENTRREAIAAGGCSIGVKIINNHCIWSENLGVGDFGISVAGDSSNATVADFLIEGNTTINSAHDGIAVAGWAQRGLVRGNTIRDSCMANADSFHAGIKLYGWNRNGGDLAMTTDVQVSDNEISRIGSPGLFYSVYEHPETGVVARNAVSRNKTFNLAASHVFLSSPTSVNLT